MDVLSIGCSPAPLQIADQRVSDSDFDSDLRVKNIIVMKTKVVVKKKYPRKYNIQNKTTINMDLFK